jgi:xanthine dehydrogenase accessory factor
MKDFRDIRSVWKSEQQKGASCVLATLVATSGSTYRRPGARALITRGSQGHKRCVGLLSGGCLEPDLMERSGFVFETGEPLLVVYDLRSADELLFGLGLGCEGRLAIWLERVSPGNDHANPYLHGAAGDAGVVHWADESGAANQLPYEVPHSHRVCVVGAGEDAKPLCRLLQDVGLDVAVFDRREGVLCEFVANVTGLLALTSMEDLRSELLQNFDALVVMSHHFETDVAALKAALECLNAKKRLRYVGCLGPARRREKLFEAVPALRAFYPDVVRAPAGFALGGDSSEAIALSIGAELFAALHGSSGTSLSVSKSGREDRIHELEM